MSKWLAGAVALALTLAGTGCVFRGKRGGALGRDADGRTILVRTRLDNGLTVLLFESHAAPVVAFQAWVAVGSADETPEEAGIAHVFEHMLFKGTARRG